MVINSLRYCRGVAFAKGYPLRPVILNLIQNLGGSYVVQLCSRLTSADSDLHDKNYSKRVSNQ